MNNIIFSIFCVFLLLSGCKFKKSDERQAPRQLVELATQINAGPDIEIGTGLTLTGCRIEPGDSLFTYLISASDTRFDSLSADSIKQIFHADLQADGKKKLLHVLRNHDMGLQYVCTLPDSTRQTVTFTPAEIAGLSR